MTRFQACTFAIFLSIPSAALAQQRRGTAEIQQMNGDLLRMEAESRATGWSRSARNYQAETLLHEREAALRQLIRTNPAEAVRSALPESVLGQMRETYPSLTGHLERRGVWQGTFEHVISDDLEGRASESQYYLRSGDSHIRVFLSEGEAVHLRSGERVEVQGVGIGEEVAVESAATMSAASGAAASSGTQTALSCNTTGPQKVVVILVNFASTALPGTVTTDTVRGILFGNAYTNATNSPDWSVDDFWQQASDGKLSVDVANSQVVGPYNLMTDYATCDTNGIRAAAMAAADPYVNFQNYTRVVVVFPNTGVCSFAGQSTVGCSTYSSADGSSTASMTWLRADQAANRSSGVRLFAHELGHGLGLSHASSRAYSGMALGQLGDAGTLDEYGDKFSAMGFWNFGFYGGPHAATILKWLSLSTSSSTYNVQVVETSGTYSVQNYEARPTAVKALRVRRGTGNNAWLWIEGRKSVGDYDSQLSSQVFTGALIHYEDSYTGNKTHLLDFTPNSGSGFLDPALPVGSSWTDPYSNLKLTVTAGDTTSLTVQVDFGAQSCTRAAPTVTMSPSSVSVTQGGSTTFNVNVRSNDSTGCTSTAFDLSGVLPSSSWVGTPGVASLTLSPGQQSSTTFTVTPPAASSGSFTVGVKATNSAAATLSATATSGVTVTVPNVTLKVSVGNGGKVPVSNPAATCTGNCSYGYPQSPTANVTLTASPAAGYTFTGWGGSCSASGKNETCTVSMNASKNVNASFKRGK